jgi:hypothetical protein
MPVPDEILNISDCRPAIIMRYTCGLLKPKDYEYNPLLGLIKTKEVKNGHDN